MSKWKYAFRGLLGIPGVIWNIIDGGKAAAKSPVGQFLGNALSNVGDQYLGTGMTDREREIYQTEWLGNELAANNQRAWEERMSNTAYQRQVADMQAAGVNPALMYGNGSSGASTPSGSAGGASVSSASMGDIVGTLLQMTMQSRQLKYQKEIAEMNNATARDNAKLNADTQVETAKINSDVGHERNAITARQVDANIGLIAKQTDNEHKRGLILDAQKRFADADAEVREAFARIANQYYDAEIDLMDAQTDAARAQASNNRASAALSWTEQAMKEKLYSDEYIDGLIDQVILGNVELENEYHRSQYEKYLTYAKDMLISGNRPQDFKIYNKDGSVAYIIPAMDNDIAVSLGTGLGCYGPTSYSVSGSFNTSVGNRIKLVNVGASGSYSSSHNTNL